MLWLLLPENRYRTCWLKCHSTSCYESNLLALEHSGDSFAKRNFSTLVNLVGSPFLRKTAAYFHIFLKTILLNLLGLQLAYSADVIRSNTAEITEVLIDTVLNPKFNPWEVAEQIYKLKEDLKKYSTNHMGVMQEVCSQQSSTLPA